MNALNTGKAVDAGRENYKKNFKEKILYSFLIYGLFAILSLGIFFYVDIVLTPFILDFTANDLIAHAFIIIIMWLFILFLGVLCQNFVSFYSLKGSIKGSLKRLHKILLLSFCQFLVFLIFAFVSLGAGYLLGLLQNIFFYFFILLAFFALKTLSIFSISFAVEDSRFFRNSFRAILKIGFFRGFLIVLLYNIVNFAVYFIFVYILNLLIFNIQLELSLIIEPIMLILLLMVSFIPTFLLTPKIHSVFYAFLQKSEPNGRPIISRFFAGILDHIICGCVLLAGVLTLTQVVFGATINIFALPQTLIIGVLAYIFLFMVYSVYFEVFEYGQTLGKKFMGLEVVQRDEDSLKITHSIAKNICLILDVFIGIFLLVFEKNGRTIGNLLSKTEVKRIDDDV